MSVETYEGILEKGIIHLKPGVKLPEHAKVYVIVTDASYDVKVSDKKSVRIWTPRLTRREEAVRIKMQVVEERPHAGV